MIMHAQTQNFFSRGGGGHGIMWGVGKWYQGSIFSVILLCKFEFSL